MSSFAYFGMPFSSFKQVRKVVRKSAKIKSLPFGHYMRGFLLICPVGLQVLHSLSMKYPRTNVTSGCDEATHTVHMVPLSSLEVNCFVLYCDKFILKWSYSGHVSNIMSLL